MDQQQAEIFLKAMIRNQLLEPPEIVYVDKQGGRNRKLVAYEEFKNYIKAVRSARMKK